MSDGTIGSVGVTVVPDAENFWRRFEQQTRGRAEETGRRAGSDIRRSAQAELDRDIDIRVRVARDDLAKVRAEIAAMQHTAGGKGDSKIGLFDAAIAAGAGIVPLAAAAGAAGAEFVALGASGVLAIKGIQSEMKQGTATGNAYVGVTRTLKGNLAELEHTASTGVLTGFEQSVGRLQRELPALNQVVAQESTLLGSISAHLAGAVFGGFSTFAPILHEVETSADHVAGKFDAWANGPGGAKFASTLSKDYAVVAPFVDHLAQSVSHVIAASNGTGLGIVKELDLFARVLNSFPQPVLEGIILSLTVFKQAQIVNNIFGISKAFDAYKVSATAAAASTKAASLQVEADTAAEAAAVARAKADEAEAVVAAQREINTALQSTNAIIRFQAEQVLAASEEEAAGFRVAAAAATAAAEEIALAAETAAATSELAATASVGWSAALGPIGLVAGGVLLLTTAFGDDTQQAQQNTAAIQAYTQALVASNGVVNQSVLSQAAKAASDSGLLESAKQYGIAQANIVAAVTRGGPELASVNSILDSQSSVTDKAVTSLAELTGIYSKNKVSAGQLKDEIAQQRDAFVQGAQAARDQEAAIAGVAAGSDLLSNALANSDTSVRGWVSALDTFNKSSDTVADRGKLIGSALVAANGDALAFAGSMTATTDAVAALTNAFAQQQQTLAQQSNTQSVAASREAAAQARLDQVLVTRKHTAAQVASAEAALASAQNAAGKVGALAYANTEAAALKFTKTHHGLVAEIDASKQGAGALVQQLEGIQTAAENAAAAMYQHELSTKGATVASDDAYKIYVSKTRGQLIDQAAKLGLTVPQATALANAYFGIKNAGDLKKNIELLGNDKVTAALDGILNDLNILTKTPWLIGVDIQGLTNNDVANLPHDFGSKPTPPYKPPGQVPQAKGTLAAFGQPTIPPNARGTVGEAGAEAYQADALGRVTITPLNNRRNNAPFTFIQNIYSPIIPTTGRSTPRAMRAASSELGT